MRRTLILLILLVIIVGGGAAAILFLQQQQAPTGGAAAEATRGPTPTPLHLVNVVIAVQPIPRGSRITEDEIRVTSWPLQTVPENAIADPNEVIGMIARSDIFIEQPILRTMVVQDLTEIAREGSDAAAILPSGRVAIAVPMDRLTGVAYAVQDGDYVDVILSFLFVDVDEEFQTLLPNMISLYQTDPETGMISIAEGREGRLETDIFGNPVVVGPREVQRPRLVTQRIIQNAMVVHVGDFPFGGEFIGVAEPTPVPAQPEGGEAEGGTPVPTPRPQRPDIITLAVTPQEAVELAWAIDARLPITLVLRSARDEMVNIPTTSVTLQYLMDTHNISPPPRTTIALEPAIRSIRQLMVTSEIQLTAEEAPPQE